MDDFVELPELERPPETVYSGEREGELVGAYIDDAGNLQKKYFPQVYLSEPGTHFEFPLLPRRELSNSTPKTSFEWGYSGEGPYLLAVSLVADAYGDDEVALEYQTAVEELLADFDQHDGWELDARELDEYIRLFR